LRKTKIEVKKRWLNPNLLIADFIFNEDGGSSPINIENPPVAGEGKNS